MGGKALKHLEVQRATVFRYEGIKEQVTEFFKTNEITYRVPRSFADKQSFGDLDVLVVSEDFSEELFKEFCKAMHSRGHVRNSNVYSVEVNNFQVDLILTPREELEYAFRYFSWNDLGNLVGRIAHKMGFKHGHNGLWYVIRDGDYVVEEILVSRDYDKVLDFLGFAEEPVFFESKKQIFDYVVNGVYFIPDIFLLHNRNAQARYRDSKRQTYTDFLEYIKELPKMEGRIDWEKHKELLRKAFFITACCNFTGFVQKYQAAMLKYDKAKALKEKFNGFIVGALTGLQGKELGEFMQTFDKNELELLTKEEIQKLILDKFKT